MRIDSSNYNPILYWACGIQLVALNYQREGKNHFENESFCWNRAPCCNYRSRGGGGKLTSTSKFVVCNTPCIQFIYAFHYDFTQTNQCYPDVINKSLSVPNSNSQSVYRVRSLFLFVLIKVSHFTEKWNYTNLRPQKQMDTSFFLMNAPTEFQKQDPECMPFLTCLNPVILDLNIELENHTSHFM